jgi:multidrug efflux pump subunit AcrB
MEARQMVSENLVLSQQIPNVSQESIILQPLSTANRAMAIGLTSENLSLIDISELSRWNIKPALMSVPGVANVSIWGHRERQMQVQVDQEKIRYTGISLEDIISTTGNSFWMSNLTFLEASTPGSGGWIDTIFHVLLFLIKII